MSCGHCWGDQQEWFAPAKRLLVWTPQQHSTIFGAPCQMAESAPLSYAWLEDRFLFSHPPTFSFVLLVRCIT